MDTIILISENVINALVNLNGGGGGGGGVLQLNLFVFASIMVSIVLNSILLRV